MVSDDLNELSKKKKKKKVEEEEFSEDWEFSEEKSDEKTEKVKDVDELVSDLDKPKKEINWNPDEEKEEKKKGSCLFWKIISGVLLVLLIVAIYTNGFNFSTAKTISKPTAEKTVLSYVNTYLLQPPFVAKIKSSEEASGLYKIKIEVADQIIDSYVTKDGKLFFPQSLDLTEKPINLKTEDKTTETKAIPISVDNDAVKGSSEATVTIVEFSDYQCPFCGKYVSDTYPLIKKDYIENGKVKYVFRDFPLDFHPQAKSAALASECAHEQNKFWEYHDLLFKNQNELSTENYKKWAKDLGLDTTKFDDCLTKEKYKTEVEKDLEDGKKYGVSGTPAFFINGKMISGAQPYSIFRQMIESELKANTTKNSTNSALTTINNITVTTANDSVKELSVVAKKWRFDPKEITVNKGDKVKLTISGLDVEHSFELTEYKISKTVPTNEKVTIEFTADTAGIFTFKSKSNSAMTGTLTVK